MFFQVHIISSTIHLRQVNAVTTLLSESDCLLSSAWIFFWPCVQNKEFWSQSLKSSGASAYVRIMLLTKITSFFWPIAPLSTFEWLVLTSLSTCIHAHELLISAFLYWVAVHMWTHSCCHVRRWWNYFCPKYSPAICSFLECIHVNVLSNFLYLIMYKQLHPAIEIIFCLILNEYNIHCTHEYNMHYA